MRVLFGLLTSLILALPLGCGQQSLAMPEDLPITVYPADEPFRLTLVMQSCSDACAVYSEPECNVSVNSDERVLEIDANVSFERASDTCGERCGNRVLAHCNVPALSAGTYTVSSGSFSRQITVR